MNQINFLRQILYLIKSISSDHEDSDKINEKLINILDLDSMLNLINLIY
jgi:hypothetical protein